MERELIFSNVKEIFWELFDDRTLEIDDSTNAADIEEWDSLNHIGLVLSIEKRFNIRFRTGEVQALRDVGGLIDLLVGKIQF